MILHRLLLCVSALVLIVAAAVAQTATLPADINKDSMARLPYLQRQALDEAGQKIFDVLPGRSANGTLGGPLAFAAYNPAVAKALFDLHNAAVGGTLNAHVRELAILVACRETNYDLEWNAHEPSAVRAGIDAKVIDVVRGKAGLTGVPEPDAAVIRFGRQMLTDKKVDSATFAKVVELYGQRGAMDIVAVMNTYAVSGFYAIAVDEQPAAGKPTLRSK
jgi:4-carboxymuconolactone decarboxylase